LLRQGADSGVVKLKINCSLGTPPFLGKKCERERKMAKFRRKPASIQMDKSRNKKPSIKNYYLGKLKVRNVS
jgi:hypothetical protein